VIRASVAFSKLTVGTSIPSHQLKADATSKLEGEVRMKSAKLMWITAITSFAALALPSQLAAQHTRYKLIDIPTLGGDKAYGQGNGLGTSRFLNSAGTVVGSSDTTMPDPNAPNCGNFDCLVSHAFQWQNGVLTDLGTLPGGNFSGANAINARGWIAGFSQNSEIDPVTGFQAGHAVLWKNGVISDLGTLRTGVLSSGNYLDNGGAVVGISTINTSFDPFASIGPFSSPTHAFIWKNGVMRDLGTLGGPDSFVAGLCDDERTDLVAGNSLTNSTPNPTTGFPTVHGFLWENGTMRDIPTLGGTFASAQCPNNRGQVVGTSNLTADAGCNGSLNSCEQHTFLWDHGTLADLGTLGGTFSVPFWLNNAGEAVGGATTRNDESFHAALWRNRQITDLGTLDGDCFSVALAINSRGQIVGSSFNCDSNTLRSVLWDKGSIIDLNETIPPNSSLQLRETFNINDRGEIVGEGFPLGCDDVNVCGHIFLLIPCDHAGTEGCEGNAGIRAMTGSTAISTTTPRQRREMTKEFIARLRARLAQRYHIPGLAASPSD
jgi:probable HAF family extracellular repeat protein